MSETTENRAAESTGAVAPTNAHVLRGIGQVLRIRNIEFLDLRVENDVYVVTGNEEATEDPDEGQRKGLARIWQRSKPPRVIQKTVELKLTPSDIMQKPNVETSRSSPSATPDAFSISELLRSVGYYLDRKYARLERLSRHGDSLFLHYRTPQGENKSEQNSIAFFYDIFIQMYLKRNPSANKTGLK